MADVIALLIVFGLLAALVGTLATGLIRIVGFGVLVALALIIATPVIRSEIAGRSISIQGPETQSAPTTTAPQVAPPSNAPLSAGGAAVGGPTGTYSTTGNTGSGTNQSRGVRAMW